MRQSHTQAVACGLGFFSIALGVTELVAPRFIARLSGAQVSPNVIRFYGMREIATGVGLLMAWKRGPWLWGRVAGDALDIAAASAATRAESRGRTRVFDYSDRSGFPRPAEEMRGVARAKKERASSPLLAEAKNPA